MTQQPWFKLWASESLLSDDLAALSDHERSIWLYLLCVSSLAEPRWRVEVTKYLARKCNTTPTRLSCALNHMSRLGMVDVNDGVVDMVTARKWNGPDARRKPSDDPDRIRARVAKHREAKRDVTPVTPLVTLNSNAIHAREEEEEEEDKEEEPPTVVRARRVTAAAPREMSDDQRTKLLTDFSEMSDLADRIDEALAYPRKPGVDPYLYVRGWLRRDREKGSTSNGRTTTHRGVVASRTIDASGMAELEAIVADRNRIQARIAAGRSNGTGG